MLRTNRFSSKIELYADGADKNKMLKQYQMNLVQGFTTNPSLMAKAGVRDYTSFAKDILQTISDLPISFEVFSDDFPEMKKQALKINAWGQNVYVKIPITNTKSESSLPLIRELLDQNVKVNITALFTPEQIHALREILRPQDVVIVSVFAGRIADTGVDPMPLMKNTVKDYAHLKQAKILWASTREALNIYQAEECGCHIITLPDDILSKIELRGKSLEEYSLETVHGFYKDAMKAGFTLT